MYPRNAASPPRISIGAVVQISDGAVQTAGVAVKVIPQGGSEASGSGTVAYSADGVVLYTPTQGETDYTAMVFVASKTGCIPATVTVVTSASEASGYAGLDWAKVGNPTTVVGLSSTTINANQTVGSINGVTFPANFGLLGINGSGHLLRVVLVDTTTSNTDMRGTDGAALAVNYTAGRAQYLDNLNVGGPVASQADINALNQSASRRVTLATVMQYERPESGSTNYTVEARTYDGDGNPANADSTPTLTATGSVTGALSGNLSAATNPAAGVYRWTYTVANTATVEQVRYDLSATISTATFTQSAFTQVTDLVSVTWTSTDASRLLAVFNKLPIRAYLTGATASTGELVPGDILNQMPYAGWVDGSFGDRLLVGATNRRDVNVTGSGHVAASVHSVEPGVYSAASFQANWLVAAGVAADTVTKLQTGIATTAAQTTAQADLDNIQSRLPAALIDGRMSAHVEGGGSGDASQSTLLNVQTAVSSLSIAITGASPAPLITPTVVSMISSIHGGIFPATPDTPPVVITPSIGAFSTGYATAFRNGAAASGVEVNLECVAVDSGSTGMVTVGLRLSNSSAGNGVVQFVGLPKGATFYIWTGQGRRPSTARQFTIPLTAGSTYQLPSVAGS